MTIRNRLTLVLSLTFGVIFILAAILVYVVFYRMSERIIFSELQKTSALSAMFYLEEDELPAGDHARIRRQFVESISNTDVKVYDADNQLTYGNGQLDAQVTPEVLDQIRRLEQLHFKAAGYYYYGILYSDNQGKFVVIVATNNAFFISQSNQLLLVMAVALVAGLLIIFLMSFWLSRRAYKPIARIIKSVNLLNADTLHQPLPLPDTKDELYELLHTFNGLLRRLSETFVIQKNFINYVSHEFNTPLAAITGNIEVFAQKNRTPAEYRDLAGTLLGHVAYIEQLMDNLRLLAGLHPAPPQQTAYRIDEILWSVLDRIYLRWPIEKSLIYTTLDVQDAEKLLANGNSGQLEIALFNLIDNAVKYSDGNPVTVLLAEMPDGHIRLTIQDKGKGIPSEEVPLIHQPFYRGRNVGNTAGSGIGLSLAILLCKQLAIAFSIHSDEGRGTCVTLTWPISEL